MAYVQSSRSEDTLSHLLSGETFKLIQNESSLEKTQRLSNFYAVFIFKDRLIFDVFDADLNLINSLD